MLQSAPSPDKALSHRSSLLVVEDDPTILLLLTYTLRRRYDIETAHHVDEALTIAGRRTFDALVLDINLSEKRTGVDLLDLLRQWPAYEHVPALACTACTFLNEPAYYQEAGFDETVAKPFELEGLLAAIERMLAERKNEHRPEGGCFEIN